MKSIFHKISHLLGTNKGNPFSRYEDGKLIFYFQCECGELSNRFHFTEEMIDEELKKSN